LQNDFSYDSSYWTNNETYGVEDGLGGLTEKQTKLASYWNTPFEKLCLGMKVKNVTKWIEVHYEAISLFDVIAHGNFTPTAAGRNAWKSLIDDSILQQYCDKEGFNLDYVHPDRYMKIRIGLVGNNENECVSPDSYIGFGISEAYGYVTRTSSCGNACRFDPIKVIAAFGFVLIK
jgi:hypothetical protein